MPRLAGLAADITALPEQVSLLALLARATIKIATKPQRNFHSMFSGRMEEMQTGSRAVLMTFTRFAKPLVLALTLLAWSASPAANPQEVFLKTEGLTFSDEVVARADEPSPNAGDRPRALPTTPEQLDRRYPFYMPMQGLRAPAVTLRIKCDASRAAGREIYDGRSADTLGGRVEGGYEFVYEAFDGAGRPCVYPFAPWLPQIVGGLEGTQYLFRSSVAGQQVTFRTGDQWATINLRLFDVGRQRMHFEMRDIALDFPQAVQARGAIHLEVTGAQPPGLLTAVIRRSTIFGGKNAIFATSGQTMLYIEDSAITGNVGDNTDQEHSTYINGILVSHFRNTSWSGQKGWVDIASGHQLKDKAYLRVYENVMVSNLPKATTPSAMPLIDATAFGFTWANNLHIKRVQPQQKVRDALVDLRTSIFYGAGQNFPWDVMVNDSWRMPASSPAAPLSVLDQVYLSVFQNTTIESFRTEPYVFALRPQGLGLKPGSTNVLGQDRTARAQQRLVSLAFNTKGTFERVYAPDGWTFTDPQLPEEARWVKDRDAFIRHALGLIGR